MKTPRMIAADVPGRGRMYYLVDEALNFVLEAKDFLDWKAATKRAPATVKAYCARLEWYYRFPLRKEGWDVPSDREDGLQFYSRTAKVRVA